MKFEGNRWVLLPEEEANNTICFSSGSGASSSPDARFGNES